MYAEKVAQEVGLETFLMNHVGVGLSSEAWSGERPKMNAEKVAQEVGLETFLMNGVGEGLPAASGTAFLRASLELEMRV